MALKFYNYDIVFAEIPDETTLAVNITNCPNRCPGCHSPHLQADTGTVLDEDALSILLGMYGKAVTCLCFMGGDSDPSEVVRLALWCRTCFPDLKTAWYSGMNMDPSVLCRILPEQSPEHSGMQQCRTVSGQTASGTLADHTGGNLGMSGNLRVVKVFDYVKTGPWIEELGPLASPTTNQRLYRIEADRTVDITARMQKRPLPLL